jgi:hypothetical protein
LGTTKEPTKGNDAPKANGGGTTGSGNGSVAKALATPPATTGTTETTPAKSAATETPAAAKAAGYAGNLGDAMREAAGPTNTNGPTSGRSQTLGESLGATTQKPSLGALRSALAAVTPAARACLGPDDPISRATVKFKGSGEVASVTVTGGAAGRPAEACIRQALMGAKLQPFADESFEAPVTIRANNAD